MAKRAEKKIREDQDKIGLSYQKDDPMLEMLSSIADDFRGVRTTRTTVARVFIEERAELFKRGWALNEPKMGEFLACMISRRQPANANTLDQAIQILIDTGRAATREEALELLKKEEALYKALRIGISLWHSGLDLEDWDTVNLFNALLRRPALLKLCQTLAAADEKDFKKVIGFVDKAIKANG